MQRSRFPRLAARTLFALACFPAWAAPPLTTIQDMLYKANGERFNGIAVIEWSSFEAFDSSSIAANSLTLRIVDGVLRVQLVPTTDSRPTAYYTVRYNSDGKSQFTETWTVAPSVTPVRLRNVRTVAPGLQIGADTAPLQIGDVTGLADALEVRPVMGVDYTPSRAAVIGPTGLLEGAEGEPDDCVRVDGTSGPCGSGSSAEAPGFVDNETPGGAVDGVNRVFTLAVTPVPNSSLLLYRNGLLQKSGIDYTLAAGAITFLVAATPQTGDILLASYRLSSAGPGTVSAAQVLCIGNGIATSETSATRLAQCNISAGTLKAGDRIEIRFDLAHSGAATGFTFDLKWGATTVLTRSAVAAETLLTGRGELGIHGAGAQWSTQNWGGASAFAAAVGSTSETGVAGLTVDFLGRMASTTNQTVELKHFLVLRYPAP
jgi:hypothetical protein